MGCGVSRSSTRQVQQNSSVPSNQILTGVNLKSRSVQKDMADPSTKTKQVQGADEVRGVKCRELVSNGSCSKESKDCSTGDQLEDTAAVKLRLLLQQLDRGQVPQITELKKVVRLASEALAGQQDNEVVQSSEEERLEGVRDRQVREWLSVTFTRMDSVYDSPHISVTPILRFKAAANTIIISHYLGNISPRDMELQPSQPITEYLERHLDDWGFDIFCMDRLCEGLPFRYVAHHLLKRYDLFEKCEISHSHFDCFLGKIEEGYNHHGNPYHNACHGCDVAQTMHYLLHATGIKEVMSDIEILSVLLAALVHDVHHPGTTNGFHINQCSEYALLYNDRSVLENHHLYFAFKLLQESDSNFLKCFSNEDYKLIRGLMVEMVLATDMSSHFHQLKHIRHILTQPEAADQLQGVERGKAFSLLLHMSDISHPGKPWPLHVQWTNRLAEEFYKQGDEEKRQGLPISPLCDRDTSNLATSQIGFIEHIVSPSFELCGDMLEVMLTTLHSPGGEDRSPDSSKQSHDTSSFRVWEEHLAKNISKWRKQEDTITVKTELEVNGRCSERSEVKEGSEVIVIHSRHASDTTNITIQTVNGEGALVANHT